MKKSHNSKPATIYDIARLTGVSGATVSRVLNDRGYIAPDTRAKIMDAARKLDYTPNPAARNLKTRRTNQIMLSVPDIQNEFYFDMISAIQEVARKNGYYLLLNYTENNIREELDMLRNVRRNFVDGLIMVSMNFTRQHLDEIAGMHKPVVLSTMSLNRIEGEEGLFDFVGVDTKQGIYLAARYIIEQGHREVGYVGLPLNTQTGGERYTGFCTAMEAAGLEIRPEFTFTGSFTESFGFESGIRISRLAGRPTAICAGCDTIALGLYRAFKQEGIGVGDEISIAGMDNTYLTTLTNPKLTTVSLSQDKIGRTAAELIFTRLDSNDGPGRNIIYQPELIVRESVGRI